MANHKFLPQDGADFRRVPMTSRNNVAATPKANDPTIPLRNEEHAKA
jgi:hypothetical protein